MTRAPDSVSRRNGGLVLLTGASGYVGGRLLKRLERAGTRVRCLARRPQYVRPRAGPGTEVAPGDVLDPDSLLAALDGVDTAYYLVHALSEKKDFERIEQEGARRFAEACTARGVRRIIYLGALGDEQAPRSAHLRSRHEVGRLLRASSATVIEFRASIIIGSGSLSFEMIRALVERLPVMVTPRWVSVAAQPIAINDVLDYLVAALAWTEPASRVFEIGGADRVTYGDLMKEYARQRGLRRVMIPVPVLTPRLSSLWLGLVTPVYARIGRKLVDGLRYPTVVKDDSALRAFALRPRGMPEAMAEALKNEDDEVAAPRWSDAISSWGRPRAYGGLRFGNRLVDRRSVEIPAPPERVFAAVRRIGGRQGWYYANALWTLRGWLDLLVGGPGMRRGRRDPETLRVGDTLDCWRVEAFDPPRLLRLFAEMKLPGRAWLEFRVDPSPAGAQLTQTAIFDPLGLPGLLYWYAIYPLHVLVFRGMLRGLALRAERLPAHPQQGERNGVDDGI